MLEKMIGFLLENACVNIRYMLNRDFKNISVNEPFMQDMQEEILGQKNIQRIFAFQHEDGWFGHELHGGFGKAMDSSINYLISRGVEPENEYLQKAKKALLSQEISTKYKNYFAGGDALDADGRGGNKAVIANILAVLKESENNPLLADEISLSLKHFKGALSHNSIDDLSIVAANKAKTRYYKPNTLFPGGNHINILANTYGWRTEKNMQMVEKSVPHCIELMKDVTGITFKKTPPYGNSFVGPFNFDWHAFDIDDLKYFSDRYGFVFWIRTLNEFAKLGIADDIPIVKQQYLMLAELLEKDRLYSELSENMIIGFKRLYAIEPSWRNEINKKCDIYFRVITALKHCKLK